MTHPVLPFVHFVKWKQCLCQKIKIFKQFLWNWIGYYENDSPEVSFSGLHWGSLCPPLPHRTHPLIGIIIWLDPHPVLRQTIQKVDIRVLPLGSLEQFKQTNKADKQKRGLWNWCQDLVSQYVHKRQQSRTLLHRLSCID